MSAEERCTSSEEEDIARKTPRHCGTDALSIEGRVDSLLSEKEKVENKEEEEDVQETKNNDDVFDDDCGVEENDEVVEEEENEEEEYEEQDSDEAEVNHSTIITIRSLLDILDPAINPHASVEELRQGMQTLRLKIDGAMNDFTTAETTSELRERHIVDFILVGGVSVVQRYLSVDYEDVETVFRAAWIMTNVSQSNDQAICDELLAANVHEDLKGLFFGHSALIIVVQSAWALGNLLGDSDVRYRDALLECGFGERLCQLINNPHLPRTSRFQLAWVASALCRMEPLPENSKLLDPFYQMIRAFFSYMDDEGHGNDVLRGGVAVRAREEIASGQQADENEKTYSEEYTFEELVPCRPMSAELLLERYSLIVTEKSLSEDKDEDQNDISARLISEILHSILYLTPKGSDECIERLVDEELIGLILNMFKKRKTTNQGKVSRYLLHEGQEREQGRDLSSRTLPVLGNLPDEYNKGMHGKKRCGSDHQIEDDAIETEEGVYASHVLPPRVAPEQLGDVLSFLPRAHLTRLATLGNKSFLTSTACDNAEVYNRLTLRLRTDTSVRFRRFEKRCLIPILNIISNVFSLGWREMTVRAISQGALDLLEAVSATCLVDGPNQIDMLRDLLKTLVSVTEAPNRCSIALISNDKLLEVVSRSLVNSRMDIRGWAAFVVNNIGLGHMHFLLSNAFAFQKLLIPAIAIKLTHFNHSAVVNTLDILNSAEELSSSRGQGREEYPPITSLAAQAAILKLNTLVRSSQHFFSLAASTANTTTTVATTSSSSLAAAPEGSASVNTMTFDKKWSYPATDAFITFINDLFSYALFISRSLKKWKIRKEGGREEEGKGEGRGGVNKDGDNSAHMCYFTRGALLHYLVDMLQAPIKSPAPITTEDTMENNNDDSREDTKRRDVNDKAKVRRLE